MQNVALKLLKRKFIALIVYSRKKEISKIIYLNLYFKSLVGKKKKASGMKKIKTERQRAEKEKKSE